MLEMMFNYINEETVMAATESRLVSCWKPLYLGERRERRGGCGQEVRMDSLSIIMFRWWWW